MPLQYQTKGRAIMSADSPMAQEIAARQVTMFASFVGPGMHTTRAALAAASKIPESTLKSYAGGAVMPLHVLLTLRRHLPKAAIDLVTEPGGVRLAEIETSETSWDAVAAGAAGFVADVCDARADGIIDHVETERLKKRARALAAELADAVAQG